MDTERPMGLRHALALMFRVPRRGRGFWYSFAIDLIWPLLALSARLRFRGTLPRTGPVLLASNHLSYADPVTVTAYALTRGRIPRYLARADLWQMPVVGRVLDGGGHIPVERGTVRARDAYRNAVDAARRGECVIFFPEAGFSDNADNWPSERVKNGVARVALETGAPVVPVVNWGTHDLLPSTAWFPRLFPRRTVDIVAGEPVDLSDLTAVDRETLDEATKRIMHAITELLADLRGEQPPG
ncbi:1-acyl-sn-glycerol-3-phosphate acyltransferase [Actinokineospora spheciospongiae]|uniref:1-acyl-sn-glycerol-3-phosphate acyltransferase n=1 Tax=Actinokineospora spheciospongiae TaxID=909613 RepID=W7IGQ3_9PSEU|nr:1-acyl-sn-glycerol-3-phosphate acyltransferase [Actinokineospora spheciospongiae]